MKRATAANPPAHITGITTKASTRSTSNNREGTAAPSAFSPRRIACWSPSDVSACAAAESAASSAASTESIAGV